ncbi:MAG: hypothetical protein HY235_08915 [Acidobacteria bacterium]|nr:hypothetical protein [Acidobacteriota bacterium]
MTALSILLLLEAVVAAEEVTRHRLPLASSVFPQGARPGTTLEAEVLGEFLDRASSVVFFDSQIQAVILNSAPTLLKLEIRVPEDAFYGPHYFRLVTPRGASAPLLFRIGDLPRAREQEPNSTLAQASKVPTPVTIDGRLNTDGDFDFYRFHVKAGESWLFDLRAARNGNGLDAALILLDATGRKLAHSEDHFIWDPFLYHTFPGEGDYIAVVQPTHRNNDPNFAYELDIRQAPHLETIAPLSFTPGQETEATLYGAGLDTAGAKIEFDEQGFRGQVLAMRASEALLRVTVPEKASPGGHTLALVTAAGRSNPARFLVDTVPQLPARTGPAGPPSSGETVGHAGRPGSVVRAGSLDEDSKEIIPPISINGNARYREPERFELDARPGETLVFEVRAGRFGSPVDSLLRLLNAAGKVVASNDDFAFTVADFYNKDSRLSYTFKESGRYTIEIRNMVSTTGEHYPYQLRVTPAEPHYEIGFGTERPYIYPGQRTRLKITAVRRDGHKEAIPLQISGLPAGFGCEPAEIAAGKNEGEIQIVADASLKPGTYAVLRVHAGNETAWRPVRISSGGGEGATFAGVDQALLVVAEKPSFSLEAAATNINLPRGATAVIPVMIRREPGSSMPIEFHLENLPAGVTMEPAAAQPGEERIDLRVRAAGDAVPGRAGRIAILGLAGAEMQEAPRVSIQVD